MTALAVIAASIFCIMRAAVDLRQRRIFWATLGIVSAAMLLALVPIQTHAVKFDIPAPIADQQ